MDVIRRASAGATAAFAAAVMVSIFVFDKAKPMRGSVFVCAMIVLIMISVCIRRQKYDPCKNGNAHARADVGDKRFRRIIIVLAAAYFGIAAVISLFMRYSPVWDMNALYRGR